jgi:hypothetical protein
MFKISKIVLGVISVFLISCDNSQNNNLINNKKTDELNEFLIKDTINNFYSKYKCENNFKSEYIFNPKDEYIVITNNGTKITFPKKCFICKDSVKLSISSFEDMSSIIFYELTTTSDNKILETGGMFNIKAENYRTGEDLILEKPYTIECISKKNNESMSLFIGNEEENGIINWTIIEGAKLSKKEKRKEKMIIRNVCPEIISDDGTITVLEDESYIDTIWMSVEDQTTEVLFSTMNLGWINIDKFVDIENVKDISIKVSEYKGVAYSLIFYGINSVLKGIYNNGKILFKSIPSNEKVSLVGIGSKNDRLYYNILDLDSNLNYYEFPKLLPVTQSELEKELKNKFGNNLNNRPVPRF